MLERPICALALEIGSTLFIGPPMTLSSFVYSTRFACAVCVVHFSRASSVFRDTEIIYASGLPVVGFGFAGKVKGAAKGEH